MINLLKNYQEAFNKYPQYSDKTRNEEKATRLFLKIQPFLKTEGSSEFILEIEREIKYLLGWKAGRDLFKQVLKTDKEILIKEGTSCTHHKLEGYIELEKPNSQITEYYCTSNEQGEICLFKYPDPAISLAHELLHQYGRQIRKKLYLGGCFQGLFNLDLSNMEEQVVITGFDTSENKNHYTPLNESLFLKLSNSDIRVTHLCLTVPFNESFSFSDCVILNATASMKEMKNVDINAPQKMHDCPYVFLRGKQITPLTAACISRNRPLIEEFFQKGAKIEAQDDIGGAFFGAVHYNRNSLLPFLLEKGADINAKDPNQNTPLMIAVEREHFQCVQFFLDQDVKLEEKNDKGETALEIAVRKESAPFVKILVDKGAEVAPSLKEKVEKLLKQAQSHLIF